MAQQAQLNQSQPFQPNFMKVQENPKTLLGGQASDDIDEASLLEQLSRLNQANAHRNGVTACSNPLCNRTTSDPTEFKQCARCLTASYCQRECQKQHWKIHKKSCVAPQKAQTQSPQVVAAPEGVSTAGSAAEKKAEPLPGAPKASGNNKKRKGRRR